MEIEKPDFIYKHHHDFHYGGAKVKKKTGIPFILHIDGVTTWVKEKWGKVYNHRLLRKTEEIEIYGSDAIVVPSQNLKNQILELFNVKDNKVFVAPNGVDNDMFYPEISPLDIQKEFNLKDKFVFGFTGTFGDWHGVNVMAEAVKHVIREIPNAYFLFVGDGNLRPMLMDILTRDNVSDYAKITGIVPYKRIPEFLSACDVLLAPSINNPDIPFFNSPVKLFEYMAMKKPIIATEVGQQKDVFQNEVNSLICNDNDPVDLARKMIRCYNEIDLRESIAENARKDALNKYDWKVNAKIIIDAYKYALSNNSNYR
jgi:glycosyltransferase involved in cell wall biosynthesis